MKTRTFSAWIVLTIGLMAFPASRAMAVDCSYYLPLVEGTGLKYENYNQRDRLQHTQEIRITSVEERDGAIHARLDARVLDNRNRVQSEVEYGVICSGDVLQIDLQSILNQEVFEAYQGMEMQIEGGEMIIPSDLSVGQDLPDSEMHISLRSNGMQMAEMQIKITNRRVTARESITVPAGTFDAYRIEYDTQFETRAMGIPIRSSSKTVEFHAEGLGVIRTEYYNERERLQGYQVLSEVF